MTGRDRAPVVVVGGGFAGLNAARTLARRGAPVLVIDRRNHHLFQPLLYQVATAGLNPADIAYPLRAVFHRAPQVRVRTGEVTGADLQRQEVHLRDGPPVRYDHLVLAAGAVPTDFGVPGVRDHAYGLKDLGDALRLRGAILRRFEEADTDRALVERGWLDVVVVGGGPTGVEMAGTLVELYDKVLAKDFPDLDVGSARVVLVEMGDELLPPFRPRSRRHAADQLRRRGVRVLTGRRVERVGPEQVWLDGGEVLPARTLVWAAGVAANPLAAALGLQSGPGGRVRVDRDLSVPGIRNLWVVGDLAAAAGPDGRALPQVAQPAIQAGRHVAEQILRRRAGLPSRPFVYRDKGSMATIGRHAAVADLPLGLTLRGWLGWAAWLFLHLVTLMGFRNRASVLLNWSWNYLTWDRGARLILEAEVDGSPAGPRSGGA